MLGLNHDPMLIRVGSQTRVARDLSSQSAGVHSVEQKKEAPRGAPLHTTLSRYLGM
jgi:hypothetical protein